MTNATEPAAFADPSLLGAFEVVPTLLFFALLVLPVMLGVPCVTHRGD